MRLNISRRLWLSVSATAKIIVYLFARFYHFFQTLYGEKKIKSLLSIHLKKYYERIGGIGKKYTWKKYMYTRNREKVRGFDLARSIARVLAYK